MFFLSIQWFVKSVFIDCELSRLLLVSVSVNMTLTLEKHADKLI